jgi:GT2 family glycosyltransferase
MRHTIPSGSEPSRSRRRRKGNNAPPAEVALATDDERAQLIAQLRGQLREKEQALDAAQRELQALVNSKAWRLTAPLRAARRVAAEVLHHPVLAALRPGRFANAPRPRAAGAGRAVRVGPGVRRSELDVYYEADNAARAAEAREERTERVMRSTPLRAGVSVIVLTKDKPELIVPLMEQLAAAEAAFARRGLAYEVIIGDTGSTDGAVLAAYDRPRRCTRVVQGLSYHFSRCNNALAYDHATCDTLLFLNNDVVFPAGRDPILEMYEAMQASPSTGIVGCSLFFPDGKAQHLGIEFIAGAELRGLCYHPRARERVEPESLPARWDAAAVTGACLMVRSDAFVAAGGMDEAYAAECQDVALCLTCHRLGYTAQMVQAGNVVHLENATRPKGEEHWGDRRRFLRRWGAYIEACFL